MNVLRFIADRSSLLMVVDLLAAMLPDGVLTTVSSASPITPLQTPKYEMLVMGDSVVWGQGLEEDKKFYTLVKNELARRFGREVNLVNKSHSGATIRPIDKTTLVEPGEVPLATPTLWQQLDSAIAGYKCRERAEKKDKSSPSKYKCEGVDFVLLNGGINDIGVPKILSPFTSERTIKKGSRKYCYQRMKEFLDEVLATFDNATVVVTGYFPIICAGKGGTDPNTIHDLIGSYLGFAKKKEQKIEKNERGKNDWLIDRMSDHSALWKKASDEDLKLSVDEANKVAGGHTALFFKKEFSTTEGYNASDTNIFPFFGFDADRKTITDEPLLNRRVENNCPQAKV